MKGHPDDAVRVLPIFVRRQKCRTAVRAFSERDVFVRKEEDGQIKRLTFGASASPDMPTPADLHAVDELLRFIPMMSMLMEQAIHSPLAFRWPFSSCPVRSPHVFVVHDFFHHPGAHAYIHTGAFGAFWGASCRTWPPWEFLHPAGFPAER